MLWNIVLVFPIALAFYIQVVNGEPDARQFSSNEDFCQLRDSSTSLLQKHALQRRKSPETSRVEAADIAGDKARHDVENSADMFIQATAFNGNLDNWDVSKVENMADMFNQATAFNGSLDNWDVSKVTASANTSNNDSSAVIPLRQMFKGARVLYMKLPAAAALASDPVKGSVLGDLKHNSEISVDLSGTVQLWVADFPDAEMSWKGTPGNSERENVPHQLLCMQIPVMFLGEPMYHTAYALTDDDYSMLLLRMGDGIPAKLANISFPSSDAPVEVRRRGVHILGIDIDDATSKDNFGDSDLNKLWDRPDLNRLSTSLQRSTPWLKRATTVNISLARRVTATITAMSDSVFEPINRLVETPTVLEAWYIEGDLEVVSSTVAWRSSAELLPSVPDLFMFTQLRNGGKAYTAERPEKGNPFTYQNGKIVWLHARLNHSSIDRVLPPGAKLADDKALIFNTVWRPGTFLKWPLEAFHYNEVWFVVRVTYKDRKFNYPVLLLLDDDVAMINGHDQMGCPKKLANISYSVPESVVENAPVDLKVSRRGRMVMELTGEIGEPSSDPIYGLADPVASHSNYLWIFSQQFPREPQRHAPVYGLTHETHRVRGNQRKLKDVKVSWGLSQHEPFGQWLLDDPVLDAGYIELDQDWEPYLDAPPQLPWAQSKKTPFSRPLTSAIGGFDLMPADGFVEWWRTSYSFLYP